jgi:transcriptional/translational regulatory protein YebC/TACO1
MKVKSAGEKRFTRIGKDIVMAVKEVDQIRQPLRLRAVIQNSAGKHAESERRIGNKTGRHPSIRKITKRLF